jgi:SAM-dependent methyltransferase
MKMKIKDIIIDVASFIDPLYIKIYNLLSGNQLIIPPLKNRRRVSSAKVGRFLEAGSNIFRALNNEIEVYLYDYLKTDKDVYILDFGCGVGRVTSYFCNYYSFPIYACDVDASAIAFLQKNQKKCIPCCNLFSPPLPFPDSFFHCVYSVSIWTHLSPESEEQWLEEIFRVVKPGGLILITVSGFTALQKRRSRDFGWESISNDILEKEGRIYKEYPDFKRDSGKIYPGLPTSYGLAVHSPSYITKNWSKLFEILDIKEACIDKIQDLVIMRKVSI